jgi:hypothetical protein
LALAAIVEAKWNGSRSIEALELTNAQAPTAVITVAQAAAVKRLSPTVRVFMTFILAFKWLVFQIGFTGGPLGDSVILHASTRDAPFRRNPAHGSAHQRGSQLE